MQNKGNFKGFESIFAVRLRDLMERNKTTQLELARATSITRQAISQYTDGSVMPNIEKLYLIAKYFNVSADYLLGEAEFKNYNNVLNANSDINELLYDNPGLEQLLKLESFKELVSKASKTFDALSHKDLLAGIGLEEIDSMELSEKTYRIAFSEYLKGTLDKLINDIGSKYHNDVRNKVIQLLSLDTTKIKRNK